MTTNIRRLFKSADLTLRLSGFQCAAWIMLSLAISGCAELKKLGAENSQTSGAAEVKLQAGPVPPKAGSAANAGAKPAAGANALASADPAQDAARTYVGTGVFVNQKPVTPVAPAGAEEYTLNFEGLDIRQIVQYILGDYLKESFTIHPQAAGNATVRFSKPVSRQELIPVLEMLLRQNNLVMVKEEGIYKILPAALGTKGSISPALGGVAKPLPNGYSVQIIQLKFVGVGDMARILLPYQIDPTAVQQDPIRNLLVLSGTQRELRHLLDIIELFDVDFLAGYSIGLYPLSTDVKALSTDLNNIFGAGAASPLAGIVKYIPIERLNALLVVTTQPRYLEEAKKWIERLDKTGGVAGGLRFNVYPVQHGKAEKLAQLLNEIYGNKQASTTPTLAPGQRPVQVTTTPAVPGAPTAPQTPLQSALQSLVSFAGSGVSVSKDARIIADNDNNALLILASPSDYETIQTALKQLDVPRRQVSVEVLIAEVTLTDELKFGLEWFINERYTNAGNTVGGLRNPSGGTGILPGVLPITPGLGAAIDPRTLISATPGLQLLNVLGGDIRATLQALGTDGRATVLSAPRVMVLDNEKASINVGDQISIDTGTSQGTGTGGTTLTTRQYLPTGIILTVTPRINAGGRVTLEVNQEVSSAGAVSGGGNPPISTRKAQTTINVGSGETTVLAGLIGTDSSSGTQGVPLLSKIPLIGGLFGSQAYRNKRTELVILITPTVITSAVEAAAFTDELRSKMPALEKYFPRPPK